MYKIRSKSKKLFFDNNHEDYFSIEGEEFRTLKRVSETLDNYIAFCKADFWNPNILDLEIIKITEKVICPAVEQVSIKRIKDCGLNNIELAKFRIKSSNNNN